jgi:hypothetical protein
MKTIRFNPEKHTDTLNEWCDGWGMGRFPDEWLPTVGVMVEGVAYASLYITDSGVAYQENIISNPKADATDRGNALDAVTLEICRLAKECGSKWLIGASSIQPVLDRAKNVHGFMIADKPVTQIVKAL